MTDALLLNVQFSVMKTFLSFVNVEFIANPATGFVKERFYAESVLKNVRDLTKET